MLNTYNNLRLSKICSNIKYNICIFFLYSKQELTLIII